MTDASALLAAIRAAPDDDAPRLVYADWLDEHGQLERADFIRVQCELARRDDPALRRREAELLAAHHDAFAGPLAAPHLRFRFERGFPVAFGHTGLFVRDTADRWKLYYRFMPDGSWWFGNEWSLDRAVEAIRDPTNRFGETIPGPYQMDTFVQPAKIRCFRHALAEAWAYDGLFDRSSFEFEVWGHYLKRGWREKLTHLHIDDLASFPET
jgi:uncharacterized protein (TIGR02996 family)